MLIRQPSFDNRRQVHHVREALEPHELRHPHRPVVAHASHIVAAEIHEHHVFGAFLLVALQLFGQPSIFFIVSSAAAGSGNRMGFDTRPFDANQHLWR